VVSASPPLSFNSGTGAISIDLSAYAQLASPTFTGDPKAPTPAFGDNDTSIATTAWVTTALGGFQPLDADLTSIAGYGGTGTWLYRSAANTWSAVTFGANISFAGGVLNATGFGDVFAAGNNTFTGQNYFNLGSNLPLVVGHTARIDTTAALEVHSGAGRIVDYNWENNANLAGMNFRKSRGGSVNTHGLVSNNDGTQLNFAASDGSAFIGFGAITVSVDGTPSAGVMPGKIQFLTRGTSGGNLVRMTVASTGCALQGVNDGSDAATGWVGQYKESVILQASRAAIATATQQNITSLSLEAGDWDIEGIVIGYPQTTTVVQTILASISQTSAVLDQSAGKQGSWFGNVTPGVAGYVSALSPTVRKNFTSTTTVYLVAYCLFTTSTLEVFGSLRARRVR